LQSFGQTRLFHTTTARQFRPHTLNQSVRKRQPRARLLTKPQSFKPPRHHPAQKKPRHCGASSGLLQGAIQANFTLTPFSPKLPGNWRLAPYSSQGLPNKKAQGYQPCAFYLDKRAITPFYMP
jgi:hypothetical protein